MRTKRKFLMTMAGLFLLSWSQLYAQNGSTPVNGQNPVAPLNTNMKQAPGNPAPLDGNTVLGPVFQASECGLNYTTATVKLGQRFVPPGVPQPATFTIAGIPSSASVIQAFIWADASGAGTPITLTITNPASVTGNYPMALVGSDVDKCWGYPGVQTYRGDVTASISGNGNYFISGFPTGTPDDIDGATMMVIWSDPTAGFQGDIILWDGAVVQLGTSTTQTMTGFTACQGNVFNARAMSMYGDLQGLNSQLTLNNMGPYTVTEDWWNYVDVATTVLPGQTSAVFGNTQTNGDCYNFAMMGLYFQSSCLKCEFPCQAKADFQWEGCNPVQFFGENSTGSNVVSWFWQFGDGQTSTQQNPLHSYSTPGVYNVCLTIVSKGSNGETCCDQVCYEIEVCEPGPCEVYPSFNYDPQGQTTTVNFYDQSTGTGVPCEWQWDFGDGNFSNTQNPVHTYADPGAYYVCLTVVYCIYNEEGELIDKCKEAYCRWVYVNVVSPARKIDPTQPKGDEEVKLYPNPASTELFISAHQDMKPVVSVINSAGQTVMKATQLGRNLYTVNVERLTAGAYIVEVKYADGRVKHLQFVKD